MGAFDTTISPMLLKNGGKPFDDKNYIFEIKFDGIRCIAFCDKNKTVLQNRRSKIINKQFPELDSIHTQCTEKCILDGEIICLNEKEVPDFNLLQKRILLKSKSSIQRQSKLIPVLYVVFDILYCKNKDLTHLPLIKRKKILNENIKENSYISISSFFEQNGKELFKQVQLLNLEGIVAKKKDSLYHIKERTNDWVKIKNMVFEDFLICGYTLENGKIKDLILGTITDNELKYDGNVYIGAKKRDQKLIMDFAQKNKLAKPLFKNFSTQTVWISPQLICTVEYLQRTKSNQRRQPVYRGLRTD